MRNFSRVSLAQIEGVSKISFVKSLFLGAAIIGGKKNRKEKTLDSYLIFYLSPIDSSKKEKFK